MSQHTAGPWQFIENVVQPTSPKKYDGCNICRVTIPHDGLAAEGLANTRIIAAAPDLLAALRFLSAVVDGTREECHESAALVAARAAIDKAEGRTPTYTDAALADFGCSPDIIARAEADAEARDINRLTGRDPHQCVKCHAVDCVCPKAVKS